MKKTLLMKQGIFGIIKAKGQFISLLLLIFICSIITSCLFTTVTSLQSANRQMGYGNFDYNYSFHYSAMDFENSNMQTITPSFAFDTEYVLVENNDNKLTYPKMTIGPAATDVFYALNLDDINFTLEQNQITNLTLNLNFRTSAPNYQNSLIAKLQQKGEGPLADKYFALFKTTQIYQNFLGIITDYINKSFLKNKSNNVPADDIKKAIAQFTNGEADKEQQAINRWNSNVKTINNDITKLVNIPDLTVKLGKKENETVVTDILENTLYQKGLRGSFGIATRFKEIDASGNEKIRIQYLAQSPWQYINRLNQTGINEARMVIGDLFNKVTFFGNYSDRSSFINFVSTYYTMLGIISNFNIAMRQEVTTWNIAGNLKYKVIGWHDLLKEGQLRIFDKVNEWVGPSLKESTISNYYAVVSSNYLKTHQQNLHDTIRIGEQTFTIGATGGDTLNIYPTIYETDFIPDFKTDVVTYLSSYGMSLLAEDNTKGLISLKDNSRVFLKSLTNNPRENLAIFKKYYANNPNQLDLYQQMLTTNQKQSDPSLGTFQTKDETSSITRRYDLLAKTINIYIYIGLFFILIFAITLFAVSYIIIKEMIKREAPQIGMLKATGYYFREISLSYWSILMLSILIAVPIGWLVGISVQLLVAKLFNMFFLISWSFTWNWMILIILISFFVIFLSIITFIPCYFLINKTEVLSLIHPSRELNVNIGIVRSVRKLRFKTFVGHFRIVILSTSLKQAFTYLGIFALVTFTLTTSLLAPVYAKNFNENYYKNIKYGSEVKYSNVISNSPLSYYKTYSWNGINNVPKTSDPIEQDLYPIGGMTPLANYYSIDGGKTIKPLKAVNQEETVVSILKDMLSYNFVTLSGTNLSLGIFNYLNNLVKDSSAGDSVRALVSEILCTVLPKALGIGAIPYPPFTNKDDYPELWRTCFSKATNGLIPASVKEDWNKNPERANHFALGIGTMSYNPAVDDVFTSFDGKYYDKTLPVYGINANTKMLKLAAADRDILTNDERNVINAIANVSALQRLKLNIGEEIALTPQLTTLQYNTGEEQWTEFTNNDVALKDQNWKYKVSDKAGDYQSLYSLDKSYFTYNTSSNTKYYVTPNPKSEYYNLNNVELWIPHNSLMEKIWSKKTITLSNGQERKLLEELKTGDTKIVRKEKIDDKEYWVIKPYDFNFGGSYNGDFINGIPTTWYQAAIDNNFIKVAPSLKTQPVKIKIVKSIAIYDEPRLFISMNSANQVNLFPTNKTNDNLNIMQWYNGKYTTELHPSDQINRYALSTMNGDLSLNNFITSYSSAVLTADYVGIKAQIMSRVIIIALSIALIFIVIIIMLSVITIYFAIDLFIKKFIKIIAIMKIQGYSRWEINNLTLGIFIPFAFVGWLLGYFITWGLAWTITQKILVFFNIYVPIGTGLITLPIILGGIIILYSCSYFISVRKINKLNIQEIVMMEN